MLFKSLMLVTIWNSFVQIETIVMSFDPHLTIWANEGCLWLFFINDIFIKVFDRIISLMKLTSVENLAAISINSCHLILFPFWLFPPQNMRQKDKILSVNKCYEYLIHLNCLSLLTNHKCFYIKSSCVDIFHWTSS